MNNRGWVITKHAKDQFIRRLAIVHPEFSKNTDGFLNKLIDNSKPCFIGSKRYMSRAERHGAPAEFFCTKCGWRLTVATSNGIRFLVTVERIAPEQNNTNKGRNYVGRESYQRASLQY